MVVVVVVDLVVVEVDDVSSCGKWMATWMSPRES